MHDIKIILYRDGSSAMLPTSEKGKQVLPQAIQFDKGETEFFIPGNWVHFEQQGLKVQVEDNR